MARRHSQFVPYYEKVARILRAQLLSMSEIPEPVRLPTESELCEIHHVSHSTIRKALDLLDKEGLVRRSPKRGTRTVPAGIQAAIRLQQSRVIAVVTEHDRRGFHPRIFGGQVLQGIVSRAQENNCAIMARHMFGPSPGTGPDVHLEDPAKVRGVILLDVREDRVIDMHADAGYPVVCVDRWTKNPKVDIVVVDCFAEGQLAADFLVSRGHRDLFYLGNLQRIGKRVDRELDSEMLLAGFQSGLRVANVSLPDSRVRFCQHKMEDAADMVDWFVRLDPRPSAGLIFDTLAFDRFRSELRSRGLRCPQDVSLLCKGNADQLDEGITMFWCDGEEMGRMAVDLLLDRASGRRTRPVVQAFRSQLLPGKTTARIVSATGNPQGSTFERSL